MHRKLQLFRDATKRLLIGRCASSRCVYPGLVPQNSRARLPLLAEEVRHLKCDVGSPHRADRAWSAFHSLPSEATSRQGSMQCHERHWSVGGCLLGYRLESGGRKDGSVGREWAFEIQPKIRIFKAPAGRMGPRQQGPSVPSRPCGISDPRQTLLVNNVA